jgi:hypothetical protein
MKAQRSKQLKLPTIPKICKNPDCRAEFFSNTRSRLYCRPDHRGKAWIQIAQEKPFYEEENYMHRGILIVVHKRNEREKRFELRDTDMQLVGFAATKKMVNTFINFLLNGRKRKTKAQ